MSDEQRPIPEFLSPYLTQEQYDRAREYLKTPHTRVDLTMEEWDSVKNGQGWPKDCTMTASQYLACQQMNAAPPSPEAAPPRPEDPLQSFDARVWADEFMKRNNGLSEPFVSSHVQVDKDTMVGWFSNALMRGYDERRNVEAPFDEQRRQIEDSRRELVRDYRDLVARCMARIAELSEART